LRLLYYPGCSLKSFAAELESSTLAVARRLGIELVELDRWYCCGVVYSPAIDSEVHLVPSARNLSVAQVAARRLGVQGKLVVVCPMCYNTMKRSNLSLKSDRARLEKVNKFMDTEEPYTGGIEVVHILELFRTFEEEGRLREGAVRDLRELRIAPYYGCTLLRPREVSVDNPNNPQLLERILRSIGGMPVPYPKKDECCGSYLTVLRREVSMEKSWGVLESAREWGAELVAMVCPMCCFNLRLARGRVRVLYLTELLCYAMGLEEVLREESITLIRRLVEHRAR